MPTHYPNSSSRCGGDGTITEFLSTINVRKGASRLGLIAVLGCQAVTSGAIAQDPVVPVLQIDSGSAAPAGDAMQRYAIVRLPKRPNQPSFPQALDNSGRAGIDFYTEPGVQNVITDGLNHRELQLPPDIPFAFLRRITDTGWAVGKCYFLDSDYAYWTPDGRFNEIIWPCDDCHGSILDINNSGQMCGAWRDRQADGEEAIRFERGRFIVLPNLFDDPGHRGFAHAINASGVVVGMCDVIEDGRAVKREATQWVGNRVGVLPFHEGERGEANDINDAGVVVGTSDRREGDDLPVLWEPGQLGRLLENEHVGETFWAVTPRFINNRGMILGQQLYRSDRFPRGWIYWSSPDVASRPLYTLYPPNHLWIPEEDGRPFDINDVNDQGQVAGSGFRVDRPDVQGFILTPVTYSFNLSAFRPGFTEQPNSITISKAPPNAVVKLVGGRHGGGAMITGCRIIDNVLQIENPRLLATATTDANGKVTIEDVVPAVFADRDLLFQAYIEETCEISNLLMQRFAPGP